MNPQSTQGRDAASAGRNPTAAAERAADETLDRLTRARQDADALEDAVAEQAWRQVSRLASRLNGEARAIARSLEGAGVDQRELVADSLLQHPEPTRAVRAR